MARIKKGDQVIVIAGKDKGKTGRVLEVHTGTDRVVVEGVQRVTKHTKVGQSNRGAKTGGIVTQEAAIHISNVMLVDPETKKATRVGFRRHAVEKARPDGTTYQVERSKAQNDRLLETRKEHTHETDAGEIIDITLPALELIYRNTELIPGNRRLGIVSPCL